jgi:hypothetical protein
MSDFNYDKIRDTGSVCYLTTACMQHYMNKFDDLYIIIFIKIKKLELNNPSFII